MMLIEIQELILQGGLHYNKVKKQGEKREIICVSMILVTEETHSKRPKGRVRRALPVGIYKDPIG